MSHFFVELVVYDEGVIVIVTDRRDDGIATLVDTVVHVTVELYSYCQKVYLRKVGMRTYENDLMIKDHRPIAATDEHERVLDGLRLWEEALLLHHSREVRITLTDVMLPGSQMAVEETD